MAKHGPWLNASVTLNGTDLSNLANQVTLDDGAEEIDITGFQGAGYREFTPGLKDATVTVNFWAGSEVDAVLAPMWSGGSAGTIVVKRDSATVSSTNPTYTMVCKLYRNPAPLSGAVGDALQVEATFRHSGTAGVVRGTA